MSALNEDYSSFYEYDPNGNITQLSRNSYFNGSSNEMDILDYHYPVNNNKLEYIDDISSQNYSYDLKDQSPSNYGYDGSGNLIRDVAEGITDIYWTVDNKVKQIDFVIGNDVHNIYFWYDANGNRVKKKVFYFDDFESKDMEKITYYIRGANDKIKAIYTVENDPNDPPIDWDTEYGISSVEWYSAEQYPTHTGTKVWVWNEWYFIELEGPARDAYYEQLPKLAEWHYYGSGGQGRIGIRKPETELTYTEPRVWDESLYYDILYKFTKNGKLKEYEMKDHLGNVRLVFTDWKLRGYGASLGQQPFALDIRAVNNYYPFGMMQPGRTWPDPENPQPNDPEYRFGFNGMEKDDAIKGIGNSYDYGARMYDSRVGRFYSIDPLNDKYPGLSAYQFASNKPVRAIDIDGLEAYYRNFNAGNGKSGIELVFCLKITNKSSVPFNQQELKAYKTIVTHDASKMFASNEKYSLKYDSYFQAKIKTKIVEPSDAVVGKDYYIEISGQEVSNYRDPEGYNPDAVGAASIGNTKFNRITLDIQEGIYNSPEWSKAEILERYNKGVWLGEIEGEYVGDNIESQKARWRSEGRKNVRKRWLAKSLLSPGAVLAHELGHTGGGEHVDIEVFLMAPFGPGDYIPAELWEKIFEQIQKDNPDNEIPEGFENTEDE